MAVCGGNGMGFFNLDHSLRVCGYPEPAGLACGPVAVVTHSGSVFSALLHNDRGLGFNLVVSAGMEPVTTAAGYLDHALELASTRVVALFDAYGVARVHSSTSWSTPASCWRRGAAPSPAGRRRSTTPAGSAPT
jgi:hypothetical protein